MKTLTRETSTANPATPPLKSEVIKLFFSEIDIFNKFLNDV